jgi:hypothetical protein
MLFLSFRSHIASFRVHCNPFFYFKSFYIVDTGHNFRDRILTFGIDNKDTKKMNCCKIPRAEFKLKIATVSLRKKIQQEDCSGFLSPFSKCYVLKKRERANISRKVRKNQNYCIKYHLFFPTRSCSLFKVYYLPLALTLCNIFYV